MERDRWSRSRSQRTEPDRWSRSQSWSRGLWRVRLTMLVTAVQVAAGKAKVAVTMVVAIQLTFCGCVRDKLASQTEQRSRGVLVLKTLESNSTLFVYYQAERVCGSATSAQG